MIYFVTAWAACGVVTYGGTLAHFQRKYTCIARKDHASDVAFAFIVGLFGPIGLVACLLTCDGFKRGFQWK